MCVSNLMIFQTFVIRERFRLLIVSREFCKQNNNKNDIITINTMVTGGDINLKSIGLI